MIDVTFTLNGEEKHLRVDPLRRLVDILREDCGLTGVKEGCGEGECGACTVLLDDRPVTSCLVNAAALPGRRVMTIEGLVQTPLGRILVDCLDEVAAVQCGFCFPGLLTTAWDYVSRIGETDEERIREALAGNICRCTGYTLVIDGVMNACRRWRQA